MRRKVFYIPGFDPFPPRRYRELYRTESAAQAAISGYEIGISAQKGMPEGWQIRSRQDGIDVDSSVEVLVWADLVRDTMGQGILATYGQLLRTAWIYLSSGALWRLAGLRKGPVIAALYPVGMLILQLVLAWLAARLLLWGGRMLWGDVIPLGVALVGQVGVIWMILRWFRGQDNRLFAYYLMHDYAFSARLRGRSPAALETRLRVFADKVEAALRSDVDEVLLVGHSSGAHLGVQLLAELTRRGQVQGGPPLGFLSLGQVVPMVSFLPEAWELRRDLARVAEEPAITWVDVTAPGDGCCFALCDPVVVSGVGGAAQRGPLMISAAFTQTLSADRWAELRWRFFRLHFQYLCAFDRPGDYDYFRITAGPQTLAERFAGRAPSPSRVGVPRSGYRSTAP